MLNNYYKFKYDYLKFFTQGAAHALHMLKNLKTFK